MVTILRIRWYAYSIKRTSKATCIVCMFSSTWLRPAVAHILRGPGGDRLMDSWVNKTQSVRWSNAQVTFFAQDYNSHYSAQQSGTGDSNDMSDLIYNEQTMFQVCRASLRIGRRTLTCRVESCCLAHHDALMTTTLDGFCGRLIPISFTFCNSALAVSFQF